MKPQQRYTGKYFYNPLFVCVISLLLYNSSLPVQAQVVAFHKKVLDSLPAKSWLGTVSAGINYNKTDDKALFFSTDANLMFLSQRHSYKWLSSSYSNGLRKDNSSDRFYTILQTNLFRHRIADSVLRERKFNPEFYGMFQYDDARGIRQRWQCGVNLVWNHHYWKNVRFNLGTGIMRERERWRVFTNEQRKEWDSLPPSLQEDLKDFLQLDDKLNIVRNNTRWNIYLNLYSGFGKIVSFNTFFSIQTPFSPPFKGLPPLAEFPAVTRIYPRYTMESILMIMVAKRIAVQTRMYYQHDKGQIAPFATNEVFNISQGVQVAF